MVVVEFKERTAVKVKKTDDRRIKSNGYKEKKFEFKGFKKEEPSDENYENAERKSGY